MNHEAEDHQAWVFSSYFSHILTLHTVCGLSCIQLPRTQLLPRHFSLSALCAVQQSCKSDLKNNISLTVIQNFDEEDLDHFHLFFFFFCWDQPNNVDSNVEAAI